VNLKVWLKKTPKFCVVSLFDCAEDGKVVLLFSCSCCIDPPMKVNVAEIATGATMAIGVMNWNIFP
jgi:hypothetical protein